MKEHLYDIDLIERYFDNALSPEEAEELKNRLKKDFEFQRLFDREKVLIHTVRFQGAKKDLEYLKAIERSLDEKKSGHVRRLWYYYAAAACIGLIALVIFLPRAEKNPEALYAAYFQPYPNVFEPTLRGEPVQTLRSRAFQAYDEGNYENAATLFSELAKDNKDAGVLLLLGNSNLVLGKTAEAEQNFADVISGFDQLDTEAKWYLSLCHLKTGEPAEATNLLKEIAQTETFYAPKAQRLLDELQ